MKPKTYKHFKVKYQYSDTAYLETAKILEFKKPITQHEAKLLCEKTYCTTNGFCVGLSADQVINHIKIGIILEEVKVIKGVFKKTKSYTTTNKVNNEIKYILGEDSINGIKLNEKIEQEDLCEYVIRHRESFIEDLISWISEARSNDKQLMKNDLQMLLKVEDEYILSSISTNSYLYHGCAKFENTCKELLELNKTLNIIDLVL